MNTIMKRVISLLLCFVLVAGYLPAGALAAENEEIVAAAAAEATTEPSDGETVEETAETTEETEPEKNGKSGKHEKPGKSEKKDKHNQETTPVTEVTVSATEAAAPSTEATEPSTEATEPSTEATEPAVIAVTGITLDQTALEVGVGAEPVTLVATVLPEDAADKTVTWTSSEPGVAAVADGVVTFGYMGEAVITATAGEFSASCVVTVGEGEWSDYVGDKIVVIAGSDYQQSGSTVPKTNTQNILTAIQKDYKTASGFIFGGDYSQTLNNSNSTTSGINELKGVVEGIYGTGLNEVFVQGNHDAAVSGLTATGAHDTDYYGVFSINEDDFSSSHSGSSVAGATMLKDLEDYLNAKINEGYSKPIFVATHLPLHATSRGDNTSATKIFNLLNAAGESGLNIIFLFGHNHSGGYDAYLGNGAIYLPKGSSITVAGGSNSTLNFTYMNNGYVGYVGGNACTHLTMTTFEISDAQVIVKRYDADGLHKLKAAGATVSGYNTDSSEIGTEGAVIALNQFEPAAELTGITVTAPAKTAYVVGDELDTAGMVVTASYDDGSTKTVTGYEVSADLTSAGTKTVTVTYKGKTATFAITVYAPVKDENTGVTVAAPGVTGLTVIKITEEVPADTDYSAYVSYDITPEGYTSGAAKVTVSVPASFDAGRPVMVLDGDSVLTTTTIVNGTVTFTATHFSVYAVAQAAESALEWKEIPGGIVYQLDTDGLTAGTKYLIVNTGADGSGVALLNAGGKEGTTNVTISNGAIVLEADTDVAWTPNSSTSGHFENQSEYLRLNSSSYDLVTGSSTTLTISNQNNGAYRISATVSSGGWWGSETTYYLAYNSEWESTTTASNVYLYECKGNGSGGYAAMTGTSVYSVVTNTIDAAALEARIRSNLVVYTASDANGTDAEATTEYTLSGTVDPTKAGTYTYTVTYGGVVLDTVTVYVNDVTINGISVSPSSGAVTVGASEAALVGATITVDVADGEDFTVPVTVGMLTDADGKKVDTSVVGTYTGLTVTYSGKTYENFTLTVKEKVVNNYPSYPDEGAVKVDKKAHGVDFQKTGVAQVELMASGVPMNQGVDVLLVLDTSSSMGMQGSLTDNRTRIDVLKECVNALIAKLQEPHTDGSEADIDIAVVHFNGYTGNKSTNYIGSTARSTSTLGGQLTNGFVDVQTLGEDWASVIPDDCSGTNYDHGLLQAYDLLKQRQSDNGDNVRKQFVLFMSDGAPFQYNGVNSNSLDSDWENWILGSYTQTQVEALSHVNNPEFYFGNNNGQGQKHRVAEAIKGASDNKYQIVTYSDTSSSGTTKLEEVSGLGAIMYSVGLALEGTNMPTDVAGQEAILKTIASSEDVFYSVTSAAGLQGAFDDFADAILYAAENAVFEDQLGSNFNIQLASTTKRLVDGKEFTLNPAPTMEVREYTIWTRAELEDANGNLSEENAKKVGTRKTNEAGSYIYNTLESVSFNATGTEAYAGDDTTNIMVDGVICANTFWFNTNSDSVYIDADGDATTGTDGKEFELKPETFLWNVGTIGTKEIALSYYVYLDDSLEGEASAGSYETNNYAILTYDNYLGNSCKKETVSPQMAWLSANVSYAYYLVNKDGQPVDENGTVVTFANRKVIVNPTMHGEIKLNAIENVESLAVASTGVLDNSNYALFDYDARYVLSVNSDATGGWEITVGEDKPATTYVTGFSSTLPFTNATSSNSGADNYDYTHTTVWFAVVWEPDALDDTVVVDYGLPVDVHVLTNDFFGDFGSLVGVASGIAENSDGNITTNEVAETEAAGTFGKAKVVLPETGGANESNSVIRYTMNNMEMNAPDVFTYSVDYTNTKLHAHNGYYYGKLTVIPATTIYYEDDFVDLSSYTWNYDTNAWTEVDNKSNVWTWTPVSDESYKADADITQDEDRPDDINYAFDTVIDANNIYGYDSAYTACSEYSLGSAMKAHVDYDNYAQAEFTFYGTGFDVISLTSNQTGSIFVEVRKGSETGEMVRDLVVDTFYGYSQKANGEWEVTPNDPAALYQVPVMEVSGLEYGKYHVAIKPSYLSIFDHGQYKDQNKQAYDFYLDAIRIYDPANDGASDGTTDTTIEDAYAADGEGWPYYEELRNNVISEAELNGEEIAGVVFIDSKDKTSAVADYTNVGPNNELYLASGQAIAFNLDLGQNVANVHLGIKSATENVPVSYKIFASDAFTNADQLAAMKATEISSSTGMYYDITALKDKTIVIYNSGTNGILSLTDIKITFTQNPGTVESVFYASAADIEKLLENMNKPQVTNPTKFEVTTTPNAPTVGTRFIVKVTTSADVKTVRIDGSMVTSYSVIGEDRVWTARVSAKEAGQQTVVVSTYNAKGYESETKNVTVTVNSVQTTVQNTVKTIISGLKSLFGWNW